MSQMIKGKLRFDRFLVHLCCGGTVCKTPKTHTKDFTPFAFPLHPISPKLCKCTYPLFQLSTSSFITCKVTELSIFCVLYTHVLMSIADTTGVHPLYRTDFVYLLFLEIQNQKGITAVYNIITPTGRSGISSVTRNIILKITLRNIPIHVNHTEVFKLFQTLYSLFLIHRLRSFLLHLELNKLQVVKYM